MKSLKNSISQELLKISTGQIYTVISAYIDFVIKLCSTNQKCLQYFTNPDPKEKTKELLDDLLNWTKKPLTPQTVTANKNNKE